MDFTRAITYVFTEKDWWKKILITGLVGIIPFVGLIYLLGWMMEIILNVRNNSFVRLPEKPTFAIFKNGLKLTVSLLVYLIPMLIVYLFSAILNGLWAALFRGFIERAGLQLIALIVNVVEFFYIFLILLLLPVIIYKLLRKNGLRDTFDFKGTYHTIRYNTNVYFQLLVAAILSLIVAGVGISLFYVGVIFTLPYGVAIYSYLVGDVGKTQIV